MAFYIPSEEPSEDSPDDGFYEILEQPMENFLRQQPATDTDRVDVEAAIKKLLDAPVTKDDRDLDVFFTTALLHGMWVERGIMDQELHVYLKVRLMDFTRNDAKGKNEFFYYQLNNEPDTGVGSDVAHAMMWKKKGDACLMYSGLFRDYLTAWSYRRPTLSQVRKAAKTAYGVAIRTFSQHLGQKESSAMCSKVSRNYETLEDTLYEFGKRYPFRIEFRGRDYADCDITVKEKDLYIVTDQGPTKKKLI